MNRQDAKNAKKAPREKKLNHKGHEEHEGEPQREKPNGLRDCVLERGAPAPHRDGWNFAGSWIEGHEGMNERVAELGLMPWRVDMTGVTIYTTAVCPFCIAAKRLFKNLDVEFSEVLLDRDPALRMRLAEENEGWRTVPMIFVGDQMIGGFSEVKSLHNEGKLLPMLGG